MKSSTTTRPLGDMPDAWMGLYRAQVQWGREMYEAFTGMSAPEIGDPWRAWQDAMRRTAGTTSVCHVPPPCWMPLFLGEVVSHVGSCSTARLRVVATNCDRFTRTMRVVTEGSHAVSVSPPSAQLGSFQRAAFELEVRIPEDAEEGSEHQIMVRLEGCRDHIARWIVRVEAGCRDAHHELAVEDCPDYRHHWYDHFYCLRSCRPRAASGRRGDNG